jgi:two-component system chemotaxis response regulator CheB
MNRVIVIGASAGGVETIRALFAKLPGDLRAPLFVVQHRGPESTDILASVLQGRSYLNVVNAEHNIPPEPGKAYIAPPDLHLVLHDGVMRLHQGPRENRSRPSIDVLFRSAAVTHGPRAVGVLLSGLLDDGVSGLGAIKRCGGTAIVQDPDDAPYPELPANGMRFVEVDHVGAVNEIAAMLVHIVGMPVPEEAFSPPQDLAREVQLSQDTMGVEIERPGEPSFYTCPDCNGSMNEIREGQHLHYRCHTGHSYGQETLLHGISRAAEDALWNALRVLEERRKLLQKLVEMDSKNGRTLSGSSFVQRLEETERHIHALRDQLGFYRTE